MSFTPEKLQQYYNMLKAKGLKLPDSDNAMQRLIDTFDNALTTVTAIKINAPAQLFRQQLAAQAQGPAQTNPLNNTLSQQHRAMMFYALHEFMVKYGPEPVNEWIEQTVVGDTIGLDLDQAMMDADGDGEVTDFERNLVTNFLVVPEKKDKPTLPSMMDVEREMDELVANEPAAKPASTAPTPFKLRPSPYDEY